MRKNICEYDDYYPRSQAVNNPLKIIEGPDGRIIDYWLIDPIEDLNDYIDFLREVDNAKTTDTIRIHINCYGGDGTVAYNIVDALRESRAQIDIHIEGACASAATLIMLAGNTWFILPHSYVMVHSWHGWIGGKWPEQKARFHYDENVCEKQFREIYKNFMTDEEIQLCLDGKDYYFDANETLKRLQNYQADLVAKQEAVDKVQAKYNDLMKKEVQAILAGETSIEEKPEEEKKPELEDKEKTKSIVSAISAKVKNTKK